MVGTMTHTTSMKWAGHRHDDYIATDTARQAFQRWLAWEAPMDVRCRAHLVVLGWMPRAALESFPVGCGWIASRPLDSTAADRLRTALLDEWIASDDFHIGFHRWFDMVEPDRAGAVCWGCAL